MQSGLITWSFDAWFLFYPSLFSMVLYYDAALPVTVTVLKPFHWRYGHDHYRLHNGCYRRACLYPQSSTKWSVNINEHKVYSLTTCLPFKRWFSLMVAPTSTYPTWLSMASWGPMESCITFTTSNGTTNRCKSSTWRLELRVCHSYLDATWTSDNRQQWDNNIALLLHLEGIVGDGIVAFMVLLSLQDTVVQNCSGWGVVVDQSYANAESAPTFP